MLTIFNVAFFTIGFIIWSAKDPMNVLVKFFFLVMAIWNALSTFQ